MLVSTSTGPCVSSTRICRRSQGRNTRSTLACESGSFSKLATRAGAFVSTRLHADSIAVASHTGMRGREEGHAAEAKAKHSPAQTSKRIVSPATSPSDGFFITCPALRRSMPASIRVYLFKPQAGGLMPRPKRFETWLVPAALGDRISAARVERAAGGRIHRRGRIAREEDPPTRALAFRSGIGQRARERTGVG